MLFDDGYLTPDSLRDKLFEANIGLGTDDLEELMHLDKGTLTEEDRPSKIIDLNSVLKRGGQ